MGCFRPFSVAEVAIKSHQKNPPASSRYADTPTRRRVGCALELLEAGGKRLDKLHKKTPKTRSVIPLVPGGNRIGTIDKRWGVIRNQTGWLHFQSPDSTWESMCGLEGYYFIDPITLCAHIFELDSRN